MAYHAKSKLQLIPIFIGVFISGLFAQIAQSGQVGLLRTHSAQTLGQGALGISSSVH